MFLGKKYKRIIIVEGMHCRHCAKKVEDALKELDSVISVKINLEKKEVIVKSKVELSEEIILKKISKLDYKIVSIK